MKFYKNHDDEIIIALSGGVPCSNAVEIVPGTTDAAVEKHVPAVTVDDDTVTASVGTVAHPMLEAHFIQWIVLETTRGMQQRRLNPGEEPVATFKLAEGEKPVAVYEYCNLHGLWMTAL